MIGILDLDMGNLRSASKAVYSLGHDFIVVNQKQQLAGLTHLIMPGVGSFDKTMRHFHALGLVEPVRQFAREGRPLLGICLGMQLLAEFGDEGAGGGKTPGLGLIPGHVVRLPDTIGCPVPHVGWNNVTFTAKHPLFVSLKSERDYYFVHSYQFQSPDAACVYASTEYGVNFTSIVGKANVVGFQFHPEKSQANGLKLLENFCDWDGKC